MYREDMKPLLWFVFITWFTDAEIKTSKASGVSCTFKDKTYSPGDSWHPYLEPFGFMFCMRCECTETGHVKCNTIKCPAHTCENPVTDPQQCCPRCPDKPRVPAGLRAAAKTCRYNGSVYQPGESFAKLDLFPSRQTNQCVMCTCSNGNIFCALKTCQPVTCPSPISLPDTCCMVCKAHVTSGSSSMEEGNVQLNRGVRHSVDQCSEEHLRGRVERTPSPTLRTGPWGLGPWRLGPLRLGTSKLNLKGSTDTTVRIVLQKKQQKACLYNGKTYSHGDSWHPMLGRILECILCTCSDGLQDCKRIACPDQYPCKRPMKPTGRCCKTCPEVRAEGNHSKCSIGYKSNLLVYKVDAATNSSDDVSVIAVERPGAAEVEVQSWKTLEEDLQLMEITEVEKQDMADHPERYTLLTTVDEDTWNKFRGGNMGALSARMVCEDGMREIMNFLNPRQTEDLCPP